MNAEICVRNANVIFASSPHEALPHAMKGPEAKVVVITAGVAVLAVK